MKDFFGDELQIGDRVVVPMSFKSEEIGKAGFLRYDIVASYNLSLDKITTERGATVECYNVIKFKE